MQSILNDISGRGKGGWRMRSYYLMDAKFLFGVMKMFWKSIAITQYCKYKQCH